MSDELSFLANRLHLNSGCRFRAPSRFRIAVISSPTISDFSACIMQP